MRHQPQIRVDLFTSVKSFSAAGLDTTRPTHWPQGCTQTVAGTGWWRHAGLVETWLNWAWSCLCSRRRQVSCVCDSKAFFNGWQPFSQPGFGHKFRRAARSPRLDFGHRIDRRQWVKAPVFDTSAGPQFYCFKNTIFSFFLISSNCVCLSSRCSTMVKQATSVLFIHRRSYLERHQLIVHGRLDMNVINMSWKQTYQSPVVGDWCRSDVSLRFNCLNTVCVACAGDLSGDLLFYCHYATVVLANDRRSFCVVSAQTPSKVKCPPRAFTTRSPTREQTEAVVKALISLFPWFWL